MFVLRLLGYGIWFPLKIKVQFSSDETLHSSVYIHLVWETSPLRNPHPYQDPEQFHRLWAFWINLHRPPRPVTTTDQISIAIG